MKKKKNEEEGDEQQKIECDGFMVQFFVCLFYVWNKVQIGWWGKDRRGRYGGEKTINKNNPQKKSKQGRNMKSPILQANSRYLCKVQRWMRSVLVVLSWRLRWLRMMKRGRDKTDRSNSQLVTAWVYNFHSFSYTENWLSDGADELTRWQKQESEVKVKKQTLVRPKWSTNSSPKISLALLSGLINRWVASCKVLGKAFDGRGLISALVEPETGGKSFNDKWCWIP
jgi:hypothetical protein